MNNSQQTLGHLVVALEWEDWNSDYEGLGSSPSKQLCFSLHYFFFFLLGPQTASCEDCVWKVSLIRLYTKIQRVLKTQITSGVLGNVISSYRDVKRSWWAPSYVRRSWAPRSRVQLPGPDPALLLVLRRDVMSAWMAGIKGFTVCMKWTEETPYSHSGSKNGCASGPQLVHPHRRNKISLVGKLN